MGKKHRLFCKASQTKIFSIVRRLKSDKKETQARIKIVLKKNEN